MIIPFVLVVALAQVVPPPETAPPEAGPADALVEAIRENLARIDELLLQTAGADEPVAPGLDQVREMHRDVIRDLEELIKQARYRKSNQSSGGGGGEDQSQPQGQPQGQPPPRESDGSRQPGSAEDPQSSQSQGQEQEPQEGQQQGGADGQRPENAAHDDGSARQDPADGPPPTDPLGDFTRQDTDGRWGLLPPKLQERLMNLHVDDVPERYRAWLTAYIRSMQRLEQPAAGSDAGGR